MKLPPAFRNRVRLVADQRGAASIYVSFIIMVVLSLLSLTFAKIMSDRYIDIAESQYDLQAHYAAESAINTVRATIHDGLRDREQVSDAAIDITIEPTAGTAYTSLDQSSSGCAGSSGDYGYALDAVGNTLVVGAPSASAFGSVCVLTKQSDQPDWSAATGGVEPAPASNAIPDSGARFGAAVALHSSGNVLAVGAPADRSGRGSVYIFENSGASWGFATKIIPGAGTGSETGLAAGQLVELSADPSGFGSALEWHGGSLLVGVPGAQKIYRLGANWALEDPVSGVASARSDFGSIIISGSVRHFEKRPGETSRNADLLFGVKSSGRSEIDLAESWNAPRERFCEYTLNRTTGDCFGRGNGSNDVITDFDVSGGILAVGYGSDNRIDILEREGSNWVQKYRIVEPAASVSGWQKLGELPSSSSRAGAALALVPTRNNDRLLVVGDPGDGKIHFFNVKSNDILNDIWAAGLDQDCPDKDNAHEAWRNSRLTAASEFENIHYTCVSVEVDPSKLIYDHVGTDRSLVLPLYPSVGETYDDANLTSLTFEWGHVDGSVNFRGSGHEFPDTATWGTEGVPVLRVQITAVDLASTFDRQSLVDGTRVFFFYPEGGSGGSTSWPANAADDGQIVSGNCDSSKNALPCSVTVSAMPGSSATSRMVYFTRVQPIYNDAQLRISGDLQSSLGEAHFKNIQAVITATGWSGHVAQRIRERIPLRPIYDLPEYGIDSAEDLCKILVTTGYTGVFLDQMEDLLVSNGGPLTQAEINAIRNDPSCSLKTEHQ